MRSRLSSIAVGVIMLVLLLVGVASASYPIFHYDEERTGYIPGDGPQTNAILWVAETGEYADGSPAVHNGKVFVATWPDMDFTDVDPMGLVCCNATTGAEIWMNELGGADVGSVSGVAIADGQIYLGGTDGRLYCIDEETGETLWVSDRIDKTGYFGLSSSPLVYEGMIYTLSASDGVLHAFTPEGIGSWSFPTGGAVGYFTSPAAADRKVFVAGNESNLFCIDTSTQTDAWNVSLPTAVKSTPVVSDGKVYVTTVEGLHALDASTGDEIWNASLGGTFSTPVVAGETIITGSSDGLHAYDGGTGNPLWNFPSARMDASPVVAGNLVYAATNEKTGTLYAVDARTGEEVWSYTLKAPGGGSDAAFFASSPAVSDGVLYIGAENNRFYAFGDGEATEPAFVRWSRTVPLTDGETFTVTPSNNESATYTINRTSALGALDAAAKKSRFDYTVKETDDGLILSSIGGIDGNEASGASWHYSVNNEIPDGVQAADYQLADGNTIAFWYGAPGSAPETAGAMIRIIASIQAPSEPVPTLWEGSVVLTRDETFQFVPSNNASASYTVDRTTDLGALALAAQAGGFTFSASDAWYASMGSFFLEDIAGIANEDWQQENARSWSIFINDAAAPAGLGGNTLADGDRLAFYYCPSDPATYAPFIDQAEHTVIIDITVSDFVWEGSVSLTKDETFQFVPSNNASASYTVDRITDLGALALAAQAGGFTFSASDAWYASMGSFFLEDIAGIANEDWQQENARSWSIFINGAVAPAGLGGNTLADGDRLAFYYCPSDPATYAPLIDQAEHTIIIDIAVRDFAWEGSVSLTRDEIFQFVPSNNASASYTIDRTTDLGALALAAQAGGFTFSASDAWYASMGSFFLEDIAGIANEDWSQENARSWSIFINDVAAPAGLGGNTLADGDRLAFYYCPSDPATYAPFIDQAEHTVIIDITVSDFVWEGSVVLTKDETFQFVPSNNASASYTVDRTTDLGALALAAQAGDFTFSASDAWYASMGSFFLEDIAGIANEDWSQENARSWSIFINDIAAPAGIGGNTLADGDRLAFYYCPADPATYAPLIDRADHTVIIDISISTPDGGSDSGGGDSSGGDTSSSWITVTLNPGTFTLTADNSKKTYDVNRQTALGALDAAGVGYTITDSNYQQFGSLFIDSVRGRKNEGLSGWMYQVNGETPGVGANAQAVRNGDEVIFYWSESMSSTPASSSDVIYIRVVIPASSGGSGPDSPGKEGSTPASIGGDEESVDPDSASFSLDMPAGVTVESGESGQIFSVKTAGEEVTVSGNTFAINRSGVVLTIAAKEINEKGGVASGLIESVTASISPVAGEIEGLGNITASLDLNLTGIPAAGSRLDITFNATPERVAGDAFTLAAAERDEEITALAYTMTVTRTNLENGEDIAGAVIRMTISPGWVEEHGGVDALRIARFAEDGTYQVLETRIAGIDESGNLIVEATSPGGLSVFGLLAVRSAPMTQGTPATVATTAAAPATLSTTATPASLSSPFIISAMGAVLLIGAVYLVIMRRREQ